jgi:hypothetical protein
MSRGSREKEGCQGRTEKRVGGVIAKIVKIVVVELGCVTWKIILT